MSKNYLEIIKRTLVNNGEYDFTNEEIANKFAQRVLYEAENDYRSEGYHHKYKEFEEFLYSHHVDSIAYWLYKDKYSVYLKG